LVVFGGYAAKTNQKLWCGAQPQAVAIRWSRSMVDTAAKTAQTETMSRIDPGMSLPLSWTRTPTAQVLAQPIRLPLSGMRWLAQVDLPHDLRFTEYYAAHLAHMPDLLIRGCPPEVANWLATHGWTTARVGLEAHVDLQQAQLQRRSVQKMAHAARRFGAVRDVPWSHAAAEQVATLIQQSAVSGRPQLRHLFRTHFDPALRCFAFVDAHERWQGALLLSLPHPERAVIELMLRDQQAPGGVIEALIQAAGQSLRQQGVRWLSLNEVPFIHQTHTLSPLEWMIQLAGQQLRPVYNSAGLYRFKAKFQPEWSPVYLCAHPRLTLRALTDLFHVSGCAELWFSQWQR
jgi:hypothetical protein